MVVQVYSTSAQEAEAEGSESECDPISKRKQKSILNTDNTSTWELTFIADGNSRAYSHSGRNWAFLTKLSVLLPPDPVIPIPLYGI
jgi:hypothetical protein